ncbi:rab-GTPase-TBC domain-containing protein [Pilaira anomala]|nr:rab-GTPase-TBC domain-containing protein [Pilaira anomala]
MSIMTVTESTLLTTPEVLTQLEENTIKIRPMPSKSAETKQQTLLYDIVPEKSTSLTLAERRNHHPIPASLKLHQEKPFNVKEQEKLILNIYSKLDSNTAMSLDKRLELLDTEIQPENRKSVWISLCQPSLEIQSLYATLGPGPFDAMIEKEQSDPVLARLLKAYSVYDPQVGYHATLAYLVTPLLNLDMPENQMFSVFVRLMETYHMRQMYMEGLGLLLEQFEILFKSTCPELSSHLSGLSVQASMYATQWFLTLFNMPHVMQFYDLVWLQGAVQTMMRTSIWILQTNQSHLLSLSQPDSIVQFLNDFQCQTIDIQEILAVSIDKVSFDFGVNKDSKLEKQLEELTAALLLLQKEHGSLSQENKKLKIHEMDYEAAQSKLVKRNAFLEKRVKKYKVKLANSIADLKSSTTSASAAPQRELLDPKTRRQDQFTSFVASLRDTGDFGALIASALAPSTDPLPTQPQETQEDDNQKKLDMALQNVTSELVQVKLDHFESCQRYQSLVHHCQELTTQMNSMQEAQTALCQKVIYLESELEDVVTERDQIYADQEEVLAMAMVSKKTCAELQMEKMSLAKDVEKLEDQVKSLQEEKEAFFMPRGTFSEEVFAAHTILFGTPKRTKELSSSVSSFTLPQQADQQVDEYKSKFVESELRCRELEKYLAETKVRLAEFESGQISSSSSNSMGNNVRTTSSARGSLQQPRRTASTNNKRHSTTSLSMLANRTSLTAARERRESGESFASSTTSLTSLNSSNYNSKRSSMYSRIWSAFGSSPPATPTTTTNNTIMMKNSMIMCEEPQIIQ